MIIARAPFRVSFCGGGSDLPAFYEKYGGCVLSCSIRKYVYIAIHPSFNKNTITLKYSKTEEVSKYEDIEHKYFRVMLQEYGVEGVEITSMADIPSGTGLGSSSSFTVAVLLALRSYLHKNYSKYQLASEACDVEINKAKTPIGKQDQFAAAFGGLNFITFQKNGKVSIEPLLLPGDSEDRLQENIMMFYTGVTHNASDILKEQSKNMATKEDKINAQLKLVEMTKDLKAHLEEGDIDYLGEVLRKSWEIKKTLSSNVTSPLIDSMYEKAMNAGALGGKLLGAGGGGFMLLYVKPEKHEAVREALKNYIELDFKIDYEGASIIHRLSK